MSNQLNQAEKDHWNNYLKNHKNEIRDLIFQFSPHKLCDIYWDGDKQPDSELYLLLRLHLSQQVSMQYFEDIYGLDEKKALSESLAIGKTMLEMFGDEFLEIFNEWGEHYNLKSKCTFEMDYS